jgi:hypothetical protein
MRPSAASTAPWQKPHNLLFVSKIIELYVVSKNETFAYVRRPKERKKSIRFAMQCGLLD